MENEIIINEGKNETRIAIIEDSKLVEIWVERPDNERTLIRLGEALEENGDKKSARKYFKKAKEIDTDNKTVLRNGRE